LPKNSNNTKAGALLCPLCCLEYVEVIFDCEIDGTILRDVKALKCPSCGEEVFTPEQQQAITEKLSP
jgi:hypothetical protein